VVFIVGKALVDLRFGEVWKTVYCQSINRFTILKEADYVVDRDPGTYYDEVPAAHAGRSDEVAISL